jgi:cell wall-associated NlpC family hydrolase
MSPRLSRRQLLGGGAGVGLVALAGALGVELNKHSSGPATTTTQTSGDTAAPLPTASSDWTFQRETGPDRTIVRDTAGNQLAVLTDGARTVLLTGPSRTFTEPRTTTAVIQSNAWVRLLPDEWRAGRERTPWFHSWFPKALADTSPDLIGIAMQYEDGAPTMHDAKGLRIAGDAAFGPVVPGESQTSFHYRDEKSDFYDYLGIPWKFPDGSVQPEKARYGMLDCSGYMRMVYGYRGGYPLHLHNNKGVGLPRRAYAIAAYAPGVVLIPDTKHRPTDIGMLQPGDMVFFAINIGKPLAIDHCGMYLGEDTEGHPRFLSSRSQANGPTFGDIAGVARLDGNGFYAAGLRVARRL